VAGVYVLPGFLYDGAWFVSDVTSRFEWGPDCIGYVIFREYFMVLTVGGLTREYCACVMLCGSRLVLCLFN
jgi:hypothetical protein